MRKDLLVAMLTASGALLAKPPVWADVLLSEDFSAGAGGLVSTETGSSTFPWMFSATTSSWRLDGDDNLGTPTSNLLTIPKSETKRHYRVTSQ